MQAPQIHTSSTPLTAPAAEWITITSWPHPWPSQSAWRALIFAATSRKTSRGVIAGNGLLETGAIRRVGRRLLVNPPRFFAWVDGQGAGR